MIKYTENSPIERFHSFLCSGMPNKKKGAHGAQNQTRGNLVECE